MGRPPVSHAALSETACSCGARFRKNAELRKHVSRESGGLVRSSTRVPHHRRGEKRG